MKYQGEHLNLKAILSFDIINVVSNIGNSEQTQK